MPFTGDWAAAAPAAGRVLSVTVILGLAAALYAGLTTYADSVAWTRASAAG
jgi:hypothetical protein